MTKLQKHVLLAILGGGDISGGNIYGYRVRDKFGHPVARVGAPTFNKLKGVLRKHQRANIWCLNKSAVRRLRGNTWLKQQYKSLQKQTS